MSRTLRTREKTVQLHKQFEVDIVALRGLAMTARNVMAVQVDTWSVVSPMLNGSPAVRVPAPLAVERAEVLQLGYLDNGRNVPILTVVNVGQLSSSLRLAVWVFKVRKSLAAWRLSRAR